MLDYHTEWRQPNTNNQQYSQGFVCVCIVIRNFVSVWCVAVYGGPDMTP